MLVNGTPQSAIALTDRGLHYGDGLFETLPVVDGRPCLWTRHMERLSWGCTRLGIPAPDPGVLLSECLEAAEGRRRGVLKIIVTRGQGGRGYRPPPDPAPHRIVIGGRWHEYTAEQRRQGVAVRICETRLGRNPALAGIKHLNRLEQVLARSEWRDPATLEGIMLDASGDMVECTMSNLFLFKVGRLATPSLVDCGVAGVMRGLVMELAREIGIEMEERPLPLSELDACDAVFITNSLMGALPVRRVGDRRFEPSAFPPPLRQLLALAGQRAFQTGDDA